MIDLITVWPTNCDYPLFRKQLAKDRSLFNRILVSFMNPYYGNDYSYFIKRILHEQLGEKFCFLPPVKIKGDWRDESIKSVLKFSTAEWVLFIEQDFHVKPGFWKRVKIMQANYDVVGVKQGDRLHPCFLLMKRALLEKTHQDFSPSAEYDHFGRIQKDIENMGVDVGVLDEKLYHHMNGLSHNFRLITSGREPVYEPLEFSRYLRDTLSCGEKLDPEYVETVERYLYGV